MNKDTILDNWQEELKHLLGVCKCFDVPEADCPLGGGMTDEERYAKGRVFIASLLQAQRERDAKIVKDEFDFVFEDGYGVDQYENALKRILTQNNNEAN